MIHRMKRIGPLWLSPLLLMLAASGCSSPTSPRGELLGQSYYDIQSDYLKPVQARMLAIATLRRLTVIDGAMTVEPVGHELVLRRGGNALQSFHAPSVADWRGWGETAAQVAAAAATTSPVIARLSDDALDASLIEGSLAVLDPYSRYMPPKAGRQSVLIEGSDGAGSSGRAGHGPASSPPAGPPAAISASAEPRSAPSVRVRMEDGIVVARIGRFTRSTGRILRRELARAADYAGPPRGVILDLRNNPGGDITAAIEVASLFLRHGTIATFEGRDAVRVRVVRAAEDGGDETVPVVVLVNGMSASAAELVAAALQENGRALVVGSSSFGKGTIQRIFPLANGGELWVTWAYMKAPSGYFLHHHGVLPDICTGLVGNDAGRVRASVAAGPRRRFQDLLARSRTPLHEAQWAELRMLCPAVPSSGGADRDLSLARQILLVGNQSRPRP